MSRPTQRLPAVVFLHGIGGCARLWAPQLSAFAAAGFVPLALDLPGYGSRAPVKAMEFDALAADVEAAIDRGASSGPCSLVTRSGAWWPRPACGAGRTPTAR